jgi:hypothetical protein
MAARVVTKGSFLHSRSERTLPSWSIFFLVFDRLPKVLLKDLGDRMLEAGQDVVPAWSIFGGEDTFLLQGLVSHHRAGIRVDGPVL